MLHESSLTVFKKHLLEAASCPIKSKMYGGMPTSGGYTSYTEFEIGAGTFAEAAHCILGSMHKLSSNIKDKKIDYMRMESGHISEEYGIMAKVMKEYSKPVYREQFNRDAREVVRAQHVDSYREYANKSVESIRKTSKSLVQKAKAKMSQFIAANKKDPDIPKEWIEVGKLTFQSMIDLANAYNAAVSDYPKGEVLNPYNSGKLKSTMNSLKKAIKDLYSSQGESISL